VHLQSAKRYHHIKGKSYRFYADCGDDCWVGADVLALDVHWLTTVVPTTLEQQFAILDARIW
jgi:hypothetical protein